MIQPAKISEISDILSMTQACRRHMESHNIYQWTTEYPSKKNFENDIHRGELYVLKQEGQLIGSITITPLMDEVYEAVQWLTPNHRNLYVHRLAVHPKHQGKGFAQRLMDFAEGHAKSNHYVSLRLDTFSQNRRNQKFYEARGYVRLGDIYLPKQSSFPFHCYELLT